MTRAVGLAAWALAGVGVARAEPAITVEDCPFTGEEFADALAREEVVAAPVAVRCAADGQARVTWGDGVDAASRTVDLRDVPPALAPRVLALVAAAGPTDLPPPPLPPPAAPPPPAPIVLGPADAPTLAPGVPGLPRRAALLTGVDRWAPGALGRVGVASYGGELLWSGGAGATYGPFAVAVEVAGADRTHRLGAIRARAYALSVRAQLACARGRPALCVGARAAVGWQRVDATPSTPTAMTEPVAALAADGAGEVSIALPVAGLELAATGALGVGAGVVARVNSAEVLRLAGWHLTAGLEVRR